MTPKSATKMKTPTKRNTLKSQATDLNLLFLWTYLRNIKGPKLNHKEVAQQLGMTPEAAKSRYHSLKKYFNAVTAEAEDRGEAAQADVMDEEQMVSNHEPADEQPKVKLEDLEDGV
ncbi:uncharacterized protein N7459_002845 [Penicillium hispanicum]|uniref:uncharacterized protein n=1 Tax=Penicillium hispanicum TaxID=1080232 RepID=UPI002541D41D|nr:uncharacterized protein N7459_002845 [Penicillium hispanicum]KAJ5587080.1 hypothetical protein N7459_002845 [Penicillium hispanicum]